MWIQHPRKLKLLIENWHENTIRILTKMLMRLKNLKDLTEAYEVLSNPKEREQYNIVKGYFKNEQTKTYSQRAEEEYRDKI